MNQPVEVFQRTIMRSQSPFRQLVLLHFSIEEKCSREMVSEMQALSFFGGKRVFLTGHTGFKGAWLCHVLHALNAHVTGFALDADTKSFFRSCRTEYLIDHNIGDINIYDDLEEALFLSKPDIIIHMAAQPLVRLSYEIPIETMQTNIIGTANLMIAANRCDQKPIVAIITSDKCYENVESLVPYKETDRMGGQDPYSASKGAAEIIVASIAKSFYVGEGQSALTLRGGNVVGGGDWAKDRVMADLIKALKANLSPVIRNPNAVRPWQQILDVLSGYLAAIMHVYNQPRGTFHQFNIGPLTDNEANVANLATLVCDYWGSGLKPEILSEPSKLHEANLLKLDISKALDILPWKPKLGFDETVKMTVDWYKAEHLGEDMSSFTQQQIIRYFT
jgi:CDP-glucose 4,6-dehydratase